VPEWQGRANPLAVLPNTSSPNVALAVDLSGGFDAVLAKAHGSKKRKKHRYQLRRFQASGDIRRVTATSRQDVRALLYAFFDMKGGRLKKLGVANVFGDGKVKAFFHDLFADATADAEPAFVLDGLEVDGKLRAVTGSSRSGDRMICDFAAIADDELAAVSPGDYLFYENIHAACLAGLAAYDFGVGDEPYKRSWCNIETGHFDVWLPLTAQGKLLAVALSAKARVKARVKRSPLAWRFWKAVRSHARRSGGGR
jgi:CelD/BcsL family acetyltransferase involved in cellulose biosynthesis